MTDDMGNFSFVNVAAPTYYSFSIKKEGYFSAQYPEQEPGDEHRSLVLESGDSVKDIHLRVWRHSAISGVVRRVDGEPMVGARVSVLPYIRMNGRTRPVPGTMVITDKQGGYRVPNLAGGQYLVAMYPPNPLASRGSDGEFYPPQFYPGVDSIERAQPVNVVSGEELSWLDFSAVPVTPFRITGEVSGPPGAFSELVVRLVMVGAEDLGGRYDVGYSRITQSGRFEINGVPAGHYTLRATRSAASFLYSVGNGDHLSVTGVRFDDLVTGGPGPGRAVSPPDVTEYYGLLSIEVSDRNATDIVLPLQRTAKVAGYLVMDPTPAQPPGGKVALFAEPSDAETAWGAPRGQADLTQPEVPFEIRGLLPTAYIIRVAPPSGYVVKSITLSGSDRTFSPIDLRAGADVSGFVVTLTQEGAALSGALRFSERRPAEAPRQSGCAVVLPTDRAEWTAFGFRSRRIRAQPADRRGMYAFHDLPAGDYYIAATESCPRLSSAGRDLFDRLAEHAQKVSLSWGETKNVDLTAERY